MIGQAHAVVCIPNIHPSLCLCAIRSSFQTHNMTGFALGGYLQAIHEKFSKHGYETCLQQESVANSEYTIISLQFLLCTCICIHPLLRMVSRR